MSTNTFTAQMTREEVVDRFRSLLGEALFSPGTFQQVGDESITLTFLPCDEPHAADQLVLLQVRGMASPQLAGTIVQLHSRQGTGEAVLL